MSFTTIENLRARDRIVGGVRQRRCAASTPADDTTQTGVRRLPPLGPPPYQHPLMNFADSED